MFFASLEVTIKFAIDFPEILFFKPFQIWFTFDMCVVK